MKEEIFLGDHSEPVSLFETQNFQSHLKNTESEEISTLKGLLPQLLPRSHSDCDCYLLSFPPPRSGPPLYAAPGGSLRVATCCSETMSEEAVNPAQPSESSFLPIPDSPKEAALEQGKSRATPYSSSSLTDQQHHRQHHHRPPVPPSLSNFPAVTDTVLLDEQQLGHLHPKHHQHNTDELLAPSVRERAGHTTDPLHSHLPGAHVATRGAGGGGQEVGFVQPASYLRTRALSHPMAPIQPERAIDRDEQLGLVIYRLPSILLLFSPAFD